MKTFLKIAGRVSAAVGLALYVAVALLNYSVVQSYLGAAAGNYFSREWGATVRIGSLHALPWDHVVLHDILMVAPHGDTVADVKTVRLKFGRFPFRSGSSEGRGDVAGELWFDRVYIGNGYYHFESYAKGSEHSINLYFITDYYARRKRKEHEPSGKNVFVVDVGTVTLNHVHYKMDLPDHRQGEQLHGVEIPHMEFYDVCGKIRNVHVANDDVTAKILRLRTRERSGFVVDNIKGDVHVSSSEIVAKGLTVDTPGSHIELDAELKYASWGEMSDYLHTVRHRAKIGKGTSVDMGDVAYWAPVLWGIDVQLSAEGSAWGTIDSLVADSLRIGYGNATEAFVVGSVSGLPDIERTVFDVQNVAVRVAEEDMGRLQADIPASLPRWATEWLDAAQYIDLLATAQGGLKGKATANVALACALGNLRADMATSTASGGRHVTLDAGSDGLDLKLLGTDWIASSGFDLSVDANVPDDVAALDKWVGEADVAMIGSNVRGVRLSPVTIHAKMKDGDARFEARCSDTVADFEATGAVKLGDSLPCYTADITARRFKADAFGIAAPRWGEMSTQAVVNFKGKDIDGMQGAAVFYGTRVGDVHLDEIVLHASGDSLNRDLRLTCDAMTASASGRFSYSDIGAMARKMVATAIPDILAGGAMRDTVGLKDKHIDFNAQWTDDGNLLAAVSESIGIAKGTRVSGSYGAGDLLRLVVRSDSVRLGSTVVEDLGLSGKMDGEVYRIEVESPSLSIGKNEIATDTRVVLTSNSRGGRLGVEWGGEGTQSRGDIAVVLDEGRVTVERPYFYIGESRWALGIDEMSIANIDGIKVRSNGISLESEEGRIGADVNLAGTAGDNVALDFDNFSIAMLSDVLLRNKNIDTEGRLNGRFSLYGLGETPYFNANLTVDSCVVNRQPLGDVAVKSNWNAELNILNLQLESNQIGAQGWVGLGKKEPDLNFAVDFDSFDLALITPLMSSFTNRFEGLLHGSFDIGGTTSHPYIIGEAMVEDGVLRLDMTGVTYYFNDSILFGNNKVRLNRFKLLDASGNIAFVDGTIHYQSINEITLDLDINTDNITVLDLPRGESYYGTLLASATGNVQGRLDGLRINCSAQTRPGCRLTVPINSQRQVKSQNYITFVNDNPTNTALESRARKKSTGGVNLELDLKITPDLSLNLPMDFSEVTVDVGAKGQGDLHLSLDGQHEAKVLGSYEITSGNMNLGMISLFEKNFSIESGSNLAFQGSVPDARFDLRAVYSQRVNLSTLTGSLSTIDNTQKYLQVENVIAIAGTLQEPTIGFDLRLPGADASVEEEVFAYIDRNSERDMINQTMSLLLMGQFYNTNGSEAGSTVNNSLSGGYSMMASSVSSIVSDMVRFVDVDVNYKAGNELTKDQVDVNISKDWGKWYLESTFGYGGESRELEAETANGTVIDALIGYRISPLVHLFAYNRTNTNDYTRMDLPYKQGVGLKLTKDFDRWSELFKKKKNNKTRKK